MLMMNVQLHSSGYVSDKELCTARQSACTSIGENIGGSKRVDVTCRYVKQSLHSSTWVRLTFYGNSSAVLHVCLLNLFMLLLIVLFYDFYSSSYYYH